jgi:hypothetical protein
MKRENMIGDNDNIVLKNKLNIGEYRIFFFNIENQKIRSTNYYSYQEEKNIAK